MKLLTKILHTILFGTYPLIYLFSENYSDINLPELFLPLVILIAAPIVLLILTQLILKDIIKSSLIVSLFLLIVLYYRDYYLLIIEFLYLSKILIAYVSISVFVILLILIIRTKKDLLVYNTFLSVIAVSFYIVPLFYISINTYNSFKFSLTDQNIVNDQKNIQQNGKAVLKRDIYYLIFDQYSREDILKSGYNYDNSGFINFLKDKGFYIADKSYSNYPHTLQSLASSLNMEYINYLSKNEEENNNDPLLLHKLIEDNKVMKYLKSNNYKFIHFGSGVGFTKSNFNADVNYTIYSYTEAEKTIIKILYLESIISPIVIKLFDKDLVENKIVQGPRISKREGILFQLDRLSEIPKDPQLTFVFMHLLIPHSPYVFDEDGNYVSLKEEKRYTVQQSYVRQLKFFNKKLIDVINKLIVNSHYKPIIIIQSDEGHYPRGYSYREPNLSKYSVEKLKHKFAILNTFYFPDTNVEQLYPSITPVNTFRLLFNLYFKENYELLEDKHFNTNYYKYYNFLDVTDKLKAVDN